MDIVVLIPSLNPDDTLIELVDKLRELGLKKIIIVNDGSDNIHAKIFEKITAAHSAVIISHDKNRGKGAALKTGFGFIEKSYPSETGVVTADADGQHAPEDIFKVAEALRKNPDNLILGVRDFDKNNVPFKSRFGNKITSAVFRILCGRKFSDTQTGLRGIFLKYYDTLIDIHGERFEYEINMLTRFAEDGIKFTEIPIQTIYINNNRETHFRTVRDSALIYAQILKFVVSSLLSFVIDISLFRILITIVFPQARYAVLYSTVGARIISGVFNYTVNKTVVFRNSDKTAAPAIKYIILFISQMLLSSLFVSMLENLTFIDITFGKAVVDTILFLFSYVIQHTIVFANKKKSGETHK